MQTTAMGTVANSLPKNEIILLTLLISDWYIPYTDLRKIAGINEGTAGNNTRSGRRSTGPAAVSPQRLHSLPLSFHSP